MAKEPTSEGESQAGKRKPLTIDLSAEAVERKSDVSESEAKAAASSEAKADATRPSAGGSPGASPGKGAQSSDGFPKADDSASARARRFSFLPLLVVAILGGGIGAIAVAVLVSLGYLAPPVDGREAENAAAIASLQDEIGALQQRLDAADALEPRVAALEGKVAALPGDAPPPSDPAALAALDERLAALESRSGTAVPSTLDLTPEIDALRQEIAALRSAAPEAIDIEAALAPLREAMQALGVRVDALPNAERVAAIEERIDALDAHLNETTGQVAAAVSLAPAVAADALAEQLEAGKPFADALNALRDLGVDTEAIEALSPHADSGIATLTELRVGFETAIAPIPLTPPATGDESALQRLLGSARGLVEVRPARPAAGSDPAAIVARIRAALGVGDLRTALDERNALPQEAKDATAEWAGEAEARLAADEAVARIRSDALARLGPAE